jgi:SAM-dependent methyltransferase
MSDQQGLAVDPIIEAYRKHYAATFARHGATSRGADWGEWPDVHIRYGKMLEVIEPARAAQATVSLLDVGCGFGGLLDYAKSRGITIDYTGIDLIPEMIDHASANHPDAEFTVGDIFTLPESQSFDYAICNGILTLKLETSILQMDQFARRLIRQIFSVARRGIAFNMMSSHVNFMVPHLYYKNPLEMIAYCSMELSRRFRLDHAYPLYEYTIYVYRDDEKPAAAGVTT